MRILLVKGCNIRSDGLYTLSKRERQYLTKVLRLETGTILKCKDEKENLYDGTLIDENTLSLERSESSENFLDGMPAYDGPAAQITLIQMICKGKKNEKIAREAQETGVKRLIFAPGAFSEQKNLVGHDFERVEKIVREAVQQSGGKLMELVSLDDMDEAMGKAEGTKIILHQGIREKTRAIMDLLGENSGMDVTIMVGPEGGFSNEECLKAETQGFTPVLLHTNILRAETAAIYAIAAVQTILNN